MAKNIRLSATRISSFLSCKQKYWFYYMQKLPKIGNPSFHLGTAVHEALELAGNLLMESGDLTEEAKELVREKYNEVAVREGLEDYAVHQEGMELLNKRLNNFMVGQKLLGLEKKFGFWGNDGGLQIKSKLGVPLMGSIDKVEEYDEDTLLIIDYKTSRTSPTADQLKSDVQLSLYDLAARQMFPGYKRIILALDLLRHDLLYTYRTDPEREAFEKYLKVIYDQMVDLKEEEVKASLNMFCGWCDYKDYCSTYCKACKKSDYNFLPTLKLSEEDLINEWQSIKSISKMLDQRKRELDMVLTEKIKMGGKSIVSEGQEVYIRQNSSTSYDLDTVANIIPKDDLVNVVTINKKKVEGYVDINPEFKAKISETATTNYTSPFLATRKVKK